MEDLDHLQMLMNPRKMSDDEGGDEAGLDDVRLVDDDFDMRAIMDEDDAGTGSDRSGARSRGGDDEDDDEDGDGPPGGRYDDDDDDEDGDGDDEGENVEFDASPPPPPPVRQAPPYAPAPAPGPSTPVMSREEVNNAKRELLYRFDRLEKRGVRLPRRYSMASDYSEMQADYERLVKDRDADAGIRLQKQVLVTVVSGVEYLNRRFDPFDFHLDGWGETVSENIGDYDDVLEELHAKYRGKAKMAPELKLLMMIIGSAFMYHMTNTMFKNVPALGQVVKDNPDLMKQFAAATANTMEKQGSDKTGLAGLFSGLFGGGGGGAPPPVAGDQSQQQPHPQPPVQPAAMRGPSSNRIAEVQRFIGQQGGVPNPAVRPPLPQVGRDFKPVREAPLPRASVKAPPIRDVRGEASKNDNDDADLLDIMSAASSEMTSGGTRRKKRVTLEL